jgi:tRNA threonylcarbamoyl adenosine modification protein YeaZ
MTNILAIETSSVYCSIGLAKNKEIYIEHSQEENTHGKNIFGFIDSLLEKSQLEKEEIDFIALSIGPGSFTGLRVGCSVAQGLAFGLQKKILPVSSLMVLAQTVFLEHKAKELFIVKEAHMNDLYVGKFIRENNDLALPLINDATIKKTDLSDFISSDNEEVICSDCHEFLDYLIQPSLLEANNHAKGLLHLASFLDDLDTRLKNPEEVYPAYLSGNDQWKRVK